MGRALVPGLLPHQSRISLSHSLKRIFMISMSRVGVGRGTYGAIICKGAEPVT